MREWGNTIRRRQNSYLLFKSKGNRPIYVTGSRNAFNYKPMRTRTIRMGIPTIMKKRVTKMNPMITLRFPMISYLPKTKK